MSSVPLTQTEGHELARASVEAHDRIADLERLARQLVAALESHGIDLADVPLDSIGPYGGLGGRGERAVRDRVRRAVAGTWGADGVALGLERKRQETEEAARSATREAAVSKARYDAALRAKAQERGYRVKNSGEIECPRDPGDPFGYARKRELHEEVVAELQAEKELITNGGGP